MPRNQPPKEYQFKKGQSGNPLGGKIHDQDLKRIKHLTKQELSEVANLIIKNNVEELKSLAKAPNSSVIQVMLASVAIKIISKGDMHALDVLLNRLVGKVKDEVHHSGSVPAQVIVTLPANGREAPEE